MVVVLSLAWTGEVRYMLPSKTKFIFKLFVLIPLQTTVAMGIAGCVAYFMLDFVPGINRLQRLGALVLFPFGGMIIGFYEGLRYFVSFRRLKKATLLEPPKKDNSLE